MKNTINYSTTYYKVHLIIKFEIKLKIYLSTSYIPVTYDYCDIKYVFIFLKSVFESY